MTIPQSLPVELAFSGAAIEVTAKAMRRRSRRSPRNWSGWIEEDVEERSF